MFYLLEDNRIIDSEELKRKISLDAKVGIIDNELIVTLDNFPIFRSESKIKNQSQNVYDLIEKGDLVKTLGIFRVDEINTPLKQIYSFLDRESIMVINTLGVKAIYKPDANGNYIKVWGKKEGEQ